MKRKWTLSLLLFLAMLALTACGNKAEQVPAENAPQESQKVIRNGHLEKSASEQQAFDAFTPDQPTLFSVVEEKEYATVSAMTLDLSGGRIDFMAIPNCLANYLMARDNQYVVKAFNENAREDYCMATRDTDSDLCGNLNDAIAALQADGTMDRLVKAYIED